LKHWLCVLKRAFDVTLIQLSFGFLMLMTIPQKEIFACVFVHSIPAFNALKVTFTWCMSLA
jgi:hypothetical protein